MFSRKSLLMVLLAGLLLMLAVGCGDDDDNGTGPDIQPFTPAELVGTWEWSYATENDVVHSSFAEYSFTDTSTAQELQFVAGGTWETREYYNGTGPVYTRSGTCYEEDSLLYVACTDENGAPGDGVYESAEYEVTGSVLSFHYEIQTSPTDTLHLIAYYVKQQ